jgi:uncharacterized protein YjiS (DUF1127 family)
MKSICWTDGWQVHIFINVGTKPYYRPSRRTYRTLETEMALVIASGRPEAATLSFSPVTAILNWIAGAAEARGRRAALKALLAMDESRLNDLGLDRQDIIDAMSGSVSLNARRAHHSRVSVGAL